MNLIKDIESGGEFVAKFVDVHSPGILTGAGVGAFLAAVVWAIKVTPEEYERKKEKEIKKGDVLTPVETVQTCWKGYIPSAVLFTIGTGCVVGANKVYAKRVTALATAASLSETAFREYREEVKNRLGKRKEKEIRDEIADKQVRKNPPSKNEVLMIGNGEILCYEPISKRYFRSTINKIGKAINDINSDLLTYNYVSANDYMGALGLSWDPDLDELGWQCFSKDDFLDVSYGHKLADDYTPVLVVTVSRPPSYDYDKFRN